MKVEYTDTVIIRIVNTPRGLESIVITTKSRKGRFEATVSSFLLYLNKIRGVSIDSLLL